MLEITSLAISSPPRVSTGLPIDALTCVHGSESALPYGALRRHSAMYSRHAASIASRSERACA